MRRKAYKQNNGFKIKGTYVESGTPNGGHNLNLERIDEKLKILKIKRDELLLLCLTNSYRH
jgi:hypothetical protein